VLRLDLGRKVSAEEFIYATAIGKSIGARIISVRFRAFFPLGLCKSPCERDLLCGGTLQFSMEIDSAACTRNDRYRYRPETRKENRDSLTFAEQLKRCRCVWNKRARDAVL
jgi:hypothetical protein